MAAVLGQVPITDWKHGLLGRDELCSLASYELGKKWCEYSVGQGRAIAVNEGIRPWEPE